MSEAKVREALGAGEYETTEDAARRVVGELHEAKNEIGPGGTVPAGSPLYYALRQLSDACMRAGLCLEGDTWVNIVKAGAIGVGILHIEHKAADNVRAERDNLRRLVSDLRADLGLKDTEDLRPKVQALRAKFQELQSRVYEALEKVALDG